MINLDLRTLLPLTRKAFDEGRLQAQTAPGKATGCFYAGPCAIGAGLTPEQALLLDDPKARRDGDGEEYTPDSSIYALISVGLVEVPDGQQVDFELLQYDHDRVVNRGTGCMGDFEDTLKALEAKWCS